MKGSRKELITRRSRVQIPPPLRQEAWATCPGFLAFPMDLDQDAGSTRFRRASAAQLDLGSPRSDGRRDLAPPPLRRKAPVSELLAGASTVCGLLLPSLLPDVLPGSTCRSSRSDQVLEHSGGFSLHAGEDVLVGVDGERRVPVSESFRHDLDGYSSFDEQGAVGGRGVGWVGHPLWR